LAWTVEFDSEAADDIRRLDRPVQRRILNYLRERIAAADDPQKFGAPLRRELAGFWKYRVGDYRLICRLEEEKLVVLVVRVGHRRNVYSRPRRATGKKR